MKQAELLIGQYFEVDFEKLSDEDFYQLYVDALYLEEREIDRMAAAIAKAFGAD